MKYGYRCAACEHAFDIDVPIGKASASVSCPRCQASARRSYAGISFNVPGCSISTAPTSRTKTMGEEMLKRNVEAGKRMKANRPPVRRVATDFGGGDVRAT